MNASKQEVWDTLSNPNYHMLKEINIAVDQFRNIPGVKVKTWKIWPIFFAEINNTQFLFDYTFMWPANCLRKQILGMRTQLRNNGMWPLAKAQDRKWAKEIKVRLD